MKRRNGMEIRYCDALGRFIIPISIRRSLGITPDTPLELAVYEPDTITITVRNTKNDKRR